MTLRLRARHWTAVAGALAAFFTLPGAWPVTGRLLVAWDVAVIAYLALAWIMLVRSTHESMRQRASREDEGAGIILALAVAASLSSLGAIAMELAGIHNSPVSGQAVRLAIAGATILCSWFLVHTVFAIHYAHESFGAAGRIESLAFPGKQEPDYWDFMYFSFTIGAAAQTSDVSILTREIRRLVLFHTILSFLFNTTILALTINVGASLL